MSFRVKLRLKQWKLSLADLVEAARKTQKPLPALPDWPKGNECVPASSCSVCGMRFTDAMGRPVSMGYVCANGRCPSRVWAGPAPHYEPFRYYEPRRLSSGSLTFEPPPGVTYMSWNGAAQ